MEIWHQNLILVYHFIFERESNLENKFYHINKSLLLIELKNRYTHCRIYKDPINR